MSKHPVLLEISDRIATVTLNDPERRNPVTGNDMIAALLETFAKVQADPQVSVMILTGADPAFCAGGDIKEMNDPDSVFRKEPLAAAQSYVDGVQRLPLAPRQRPRWRPRWLTFCSASRQRGPSAQRPCARRKARKSCNRCRGARAPRQPQ